MQYSKILSKSILILSLGLFGCAPEDLLGALDSVSSDTQEGSVFSSLYDEYLQDCSGCHAPDAPGATSDTEQSLDFSSEDRAYTTLMGSASGLVGNQAACNGVRFVISGSPSTSLLVAVLDEDVRQGFDLASNPNCNVDSISDMTLKVGSTPDDAFLNSLKDWIAGGATN